ENVSVLKAAQEVLEEKIAHPILLGSIKRVKRMMEQNQISLPNIQIIDPKNPVTDDEERILEKYSKVFYKKRRRKGINQTEAHDMMRGRSYYGSMMVEMGDADALIGGLSKKYPDTIKPALEIIGPREGVKKVASTHILMTRFGPLFLADTSINHHLTAEDVAGVAELVATVATTFNVSPKIALLTYSNFGSVPKGESAILMRKATQILHERHPDWIVDGEMQAHVALNPEVSKEFYPFSKLAGHRANVLIFPNLSSANIAYNLLGHAADLDIIGPIMLGMKKPVHILQLGANVRQIVDMVGIAVIDAQENAKENAKEV
ncbi:MAG: malate dehydrogenase (oxaloacetate-decarboxylating)(NADP+), partial [Saprospiraceae bacterium]